MTRWEYASFSQERWLNEYTLGEYRRTEHLTFVDTAGVQTAESMRDWLSAGVSEEVLVAVLAALGNFGWEVMSMQDGRYMSTVVTGTQHHTGREFKTDMSRWMQRTYLLKRVAGSVGRLDLKGMFR